jgi:hypothetical protein
MSPRVFPPFATFYRCILAHLSSAIVAPYLSLPPTITITTTIKP